MLGSMSVPLISLGLPGCGEDDPASAPPVEDKCPAVSMDGLFGQWIMVDGKRGDQTHRFEIRKDGPELWLVDGGFTRRRMKGEKRQKDYVFTEVADGRAFSPETDRVLDALVDFSRRRFGGVLDGLPSGR